MPNMLWIWQGALHACFLFAFVFGDRARVYVAAHTGEGGNRLGDARHALYAVRKLRACVCVRQLLCVVCLFAPRALRLLGRIVLAVARAAWLACVCVPLFLVLCWCNFCFCFFVCS